MYRKITLPIILFIILSICSLCSCSVLQNKNNTTIPKGIFVDNINYCYLCLYEDYYELLHYGTYYFEENKTENIIYLDYASPETERSVDDAYIVKSVSENAVELITYVRNIENNDDFFVWQDNTMNLKYVSVYPNECHGITGKYGLFDGTYSIPVSDSKYKREIIFYKEGYFVEKFTSDVPLLGETFNICEYQAQCDFDKTTGTLTLLVDDKEVLYETSTPNNGFSYVFPVDDNCYCEMMHKYRVILTGTFEDNYHNNIKSDTLYTAKLYANDPNMTFTDLQYCISGTAEVLPEICNLKLLYKDGETSLGFYSTNVD